MIHWEQYSLSNCSIGIFFLLFLIWNLYCFYSTLSLLVHFLLLHLRRSCIPLIHCSISFILLIKVWFSFLSEKQDKHESLSDLYQAISQLPQPNRDTIAFLILHLQRLVNTVKCGAWWSVPCVRRVAGSNPTLAATWVPWQILHSQLPVALQHVKSDSVSMLLSGVTQSSSGLEDAL